MIKAVIFDVMGVIFTVGDDTNDLLVPFIQQREPLITKEYINGIYLQASLGRMTSLDFWVEMGFVGDISVVEREYLDTCLTLDEQFIGVARKLKQQYRLALLSNDISEWSKYLRKKYGIDELIEAAVISGDVGVRKPDGVIYDIVLERLGLPAEECVFIDDMAKRLIAAEEKGMHTILFNRNGVEYGGKQIRSFLELPEMLNDF